jgi:hypothetical protein
MYTRIPFVEDLKINDMPIERMMLRLGAEGLVIAASDSAISLVTIPGSAGAVDQSLTDDQGNAYPGMRDITMTLIANSREDDLISAKMRLGALNGSQATIQWRGLPGQYRGRLKTGTWADKRYAIAPRESSIQVVLTAQPYLYGSRRSVPLVSGAQWVRVAGNRESWPVLSVSPSGGVSSVSVSCGSRHLTYAPGAMVTGLVVFDCAHRVARANGNVVPVTLDSDWFPLVPKATQLTLTNCSGSLSYEPQTMI